MFEGGWQISAYLSALGMLKLQRQYQAPEGDCSMPLGNVEMGLRLPLMVNIGTVAGDAEGLLRLLRVS